MFRSYWLLPTITGLLTAISVAVLADQLGWDKGLQGVAVLAVVIVNGLFLELRRERHSTRR